MVTIKYHAFMKKFAAYSDLITGKKITYNDAANFNLIGCDIIDAYQLSEITRPEYEALKGAFFLLKDAGKDALNPEQCIYTMQDWQNDREFRAVPGQEITGEVYEQMYNTMPPKSIPQEKALQALEEYQIPVHAGFLMGEPHSTDSDGKLLYLAFGMNDYGNGKRYYYLGLSRPYKVLHGQYYYFDCMNAFVNDGLFPAAEFENDAEAISKAADYEATLYKLEYDSGERISTAVLYQPMFL